MRASARRNRVSSKAWFNSAVISTSPGMSFVVASAPFLDMSEVGARFGRTCKEGVGVLTFCAVATCSVDDRLNSKVLQKPPFTHGPNFVRYIPHVQVAEVWRWN